jgi:hypothetical protein
MEQRLLATFSFFAWLTFMSYYNVVEAGNTYVTCAQNRSFVWALGDGHLYLHPKNITTRLKTVSNFVFNSSNWHDTCDSLQMTNFPLMYMAEFPGLKNIEVLKNFSKENVSFFGVMGMTQWLDNSVEPDEKWAWYIGPYLNTLEYTNLWAPGEPDDLSNGTSGANWGCFDSSRPEGIRGCTLLESNLIPFCEINCKVPSRISVVIYISLSR